MYGSQRGSVGVYRSSMGYVTGLGFSLERILVPTRVIYCNSLGVLISEVNVWFKLSRSEKKGDMRWKLLQGSGFRS